MSPTYIIFTTDVAQSLREKLRETPMEHTFILVDTNSREQCLRQFDSLGFINENIITIPEGEQHKSLESVSKIWSVLTTKGARRNSVLVNIGGGLITDIGGFAASCFKRGIRCINIPTTLLAQVDASIGGKTGINFGGFKNEIGTFSVPEGVLIDNSFLKTLPQRQILSGFTEMLKHALLSGGEQLMRLMQLDFTRVDSRGFLQLIKESVEVKAEIVEADPREKGIRKALNFGHTVGHAVESVAIDNNSDVHHGDAVAYGMIAELYLSVRKHGFNRDLYARLKQFICQSYPPYQPIATPEQLYELMLHDKKNDSKGVNFTLLKEPGVFVIDNYCEREEIVEALKELTN